MQKFNDAMGIYEVSGGEGEGEALDLMGYWRIMQRRKLGVLGLAVFITLLVTVIVYMMTPIYSSSVSILVEQNKSKLA